MVMVRGLRGKRKIGGKLGGNWENWRLILIFFNKFIFFVNKNKNKTESNIVKFFFTNNTKLENTFIFFVFVFLFF